MVTSGQGIGYTGEDRIEEYISAHIDEESALLRGIYRETNLRLLNPRMASGHIQGRLLKMLVSMIKPKLILEVGTFTGYATLCMAEGLERDGVIHTVDGEKRQYPEYYTGLMKYLRPGGYLIADNTLWDGHVVDSGYDSDPQTAAVRRFNDMVKADDRVEVAMIPIRDGLTIVRKKI